jgi:hypothetical protein
MIKLTNKILVTFISLILTGCAAQLDQMKSQLDGLTSNFEKKSTEPSPQSNQTENTTVKLNSKVTNNNSVVTNTISKTSQVSDNSIVPENNSSVTSVQSTQIDNAKQRAQDIETQRQINRMRGAGERTRNEVNESIASGNVSRDQISVSNSFVNCSRRYVVFDAPPFDQTKTQVTVWLKVIFDNDGEISIIGVDKPSGNNDFDNAVLNTLRSKCNDLLDKSKSRKIKGELSVRIQMYNALNRSYFEFNR